ncbi:hypothetical protein N7471_000199 [Penicillium samsonianum]|uniref:uncharacterized protein n=1 Tax=Penicillium samsonianum TaxID=1882272 RepID=UPI0025467B77|nr:uncharacterized protein N7471_000199 [Penicillium samsonianum]KAJ6149000.1 hypothetical protein N7471_000199 [Penicillium samsonianum]
MSSIVALEVGIGLLKNLGTERLLPRAYLLLKPGASQRTFWNDVHQAGLLELLRIKVDRALKTSRLTDREKFFVRESRQDFFMTFPPERLWVYFKISRNMDKFDSQDFTKRIADLKLGGIEDEFAICIASSPEKRSDLVQAMFQQAAM